MTQPGPSPATSPEGMTALVVVGSHEPVIPISLGTLTAGKQIVTQAVRLYGWAVKETTGSAVAEIDFYSGGSNAGQLLAPVTLGAHGSTRDWLNHPGIYCPAGIYADILAGSVSGVIWVRICGNH